MKNLLNLFNWMAIIVGLFIGLFVSLIFEFSNGYNALLVSPFLSGLISVYLANEIDYKKGAITGILSIFIVSIIFLQNGFGIILILIGAISGVLGADINKNLLKKHKKLEYSRNILLRFIYKLKNNLDGRSKNFSLLVALFIGVFLIVGVVGVPAMNSNYGNHSSTYSTPIATNTSVSENTLAQSNTNNSTDKNLENNVKKGVKDFFKDVNAMYNENGINKGYLINTITINKLNKISDTEVEVTVSLNRIASNGDEFDSTWSGPFYLKNGKWVDDGNFVQTYSYNKNTGEKVPLLNE